MTDHMRTTCPHCGYHHDRITHPSDDDAFPEDGDATMCFGCGDFCIIDSTRDLGLRKPTRDEQRQLDEDERIRKMRLAWQQVKAKPGH